jgi:threonine synthase
LLLRVLRESRGAAVAIDDAVTRDCDRALAHATGVDAAPEGGCALAALDALGPRRPARHPRRVVVFNTGSGASYRGM